VLLELVTSSSEGHAPFLRTARSRWLVDSTLFNGLLAAKAPEPELPALPDLKQRITAEFDQMEALLASGTLEERRALVGCYVAQIKTKPEEATVCIGFLSGLSQMVEQSGRSSSQST
ncbi:MAG: hypothetical protein NXI31_27320, partial [bacterium]|nr:hypothetical protein [bacterium]